MSKLPNQMFFNQLWFERMELVLLSTSRAELNQTGPMRLTQFDLKIFKSQFSLVWLDLSSWWSQTDEVDEVDEQVDGTNGKSIGPILTTPSVRLRGPSRSVQFDFASKSNWIEPLTTLNGTSKLKAKVFILFLKKNFLSMGDFFFWKNVRKFIQPKYQIFLKIFLSLFF